MRVMFVMPDLPYPPHNGGKIRNFNFIKMVAEHHDVTLVASDRRPEEQGRAEALEPFCEELVVVPLEEQQTLPQKRRYQLRSILSRRPYHHYAYHSQRMQDAIDRTLASRPYDVVHVSFAQMGYYDYPDSLPVVLDEHNVEYDLLRRIFMNESLSVRKLYSFLEWKKFQRDELRICKASSLCMTTSERDRDIFLEQLPDTRFEVLPNGVDLEFFAPQESDQPEENTILFTGTIDYYPNTEGLLHFFEDILPKLRARVPDINVVVAGRNPPASVLAYQSEPGVTITGAVEDIRPYYHQAKVVVVPLRLGGGTRLKILEAMSLRKAVVSTSVGAEGNVARSGEHLLLADDADAFADAVARLLDDDEERARIAQNGYELVHATYGWRAIVQRLNACYESVVAAPGQRTR